MVYPMMYYWEAWPAWANGGGSADAVQIDRHQMRPTLPTWRLNLIGIKINQYQCLGQVHGSRCIVIGQYLIDVGCGTGSMLRQGASLLSVWCQICVKQPPRELEECRYGMGLCGQESAGR